jgi:hypothetical protein
MPRAKAPDETQMCFNHPDEPAVETVDGGGVHSPIAYCAGCMRRYNATRPQIRRG